jgi:hypothetical protein
MHGVHISNSSGIAVNGFVIDASATNADAVQIDANNADVTVEANDIRNATKNGLTLAGNNGTVNIFDNVITNNSQNGISLASNAAGVQNIVNNTIVKNGRCGIESVSPQSLRIVNNIVVYDPLPGKIGMRLVAGPGSPAQAIIEKNNLVVTQMNGVLQSNYRLTTALSAIKKGTTRFAPLPTKDKNGVPRNIHTGIQVGAFEK